MRPATMPDAVVADGCTLGLAGIGPATPRSLLLLLFICGTLRGVCTRGYMVGSGGDAGFIVTLRGLLLCAPWFPPCRAVRIRQGRRATTCPRAARLRVNDQCPLRMDAMARADYDVIAS